MQFCDTNQRHTTDLRTAVLTGLAPSGDLYVPAQLPLLRSNFLQALPTLSFQEISFELSKHFFKSDLTSNTIQNIVEEALDFPIPLVHLGDDIHTLELFHGPTLAFKDVAARFMSRLLAYFNQQENETLYILVATSGDTGGAVASGFLGIEGIEVILLYPRQKVSRIQEQQLTTFGQNITALEVDGTFDDCQKMVKLAFKDRKLNHYKRLAAANSINLARLIPQSFYYFYALGQLNSDKPVHFAVPCGNLGNLTAGVLAKKMGLPIKSFLSACNVNRILPTYLATGTFKPLPSIQTISNAMDVGNPSNFTRLRYFYKNSLEAMQSDLKGYWFDDAKTKLIMQDIFKNHNYIADPHAALAYEASRLDKENRPADMHIFLETAHPAKFLDVVEPVLNIRLDLPPAIQQLLKAEKQRIQIPNTFEALKTYLYS